MKGISSTYRLAGQFIVLLMMLLLGMPALASSIYTVSIPVTDQGRSTRAQAFQAGMDEVMLRIVGREELLQQPAAEQALSAAKSKAENYVNDYRYLNTAAGLALKIRYNARALESLLRQQGLPIWGDERPTTLVWLADNHDGQRQLVSNDASDEVAAALEQAAVARGVPLVFPVLDLQDQQALTTSDVWGMFDGRVQEASKRYGSRSILIGKMSVASDGQVSGRWVYLFDGYRYSLAVPTTDMGQFMQMGAGLVANNLAQLLAVRTDGQVQTLHLQIDHIDSLSDYVELTHYLTGLSPVKQVRLRDIDHDKLGIDLVIDSNADKVLQLLTMQGPLKQVNIQPSVAPLPAEQNLPNGEAGLPEKPKPLGFDWNG